MVLQFIFNGLVQASIIVLAAVGLNLLYGVKKFANFSHGDMLTLGAYITLAFLGAQRDIVRGLIVAVLFVAFVGILQEILIFARLEGRGPVAPLVASIGVALVLQSSIAAYFGTNILSFGIRYPDNVNIIAGTLTANPLRDVMPLTVGFSIALAIILYLKYTKLGKAMRATADNRDLARVSGVNTRLVNWATWALAGATAAIAGVLVGISATTLVPHIGATLLLPLFAAVIVGGIGSPQGAVVGAILVGVSQALFFAVSLVTGIDPRWQVAVPFALLVIVLLLRPTGIMGRAIGTQVRTLREEVAETLKSLRRGAA